MRLRKALLLTLTPLAFSLCGWGHWGPRVKIGLALDHSEGRAALIQKFKEAAGDNRADLILEDAQGNPALQEEQVKTMLQSGIQALILLPCDPRRASSIVALAHQGGVQVVSVEKLVPDSGLDYLVAFNPVKAGELQAQALTRLIPQGLYVLLNARAPDFFSQGLKEGQLKVLQPLIEKGKIRLVTSREGSKADAVLAPDEETLQSFIAQYPSGKFREAAQGEDRAACRRILQGSQVLTIYHPPQKLAEETLYLAAKLARKAHEFDCQFTALENGRGKTQAVLLTPLAVDMKNLEGTMLHDQGWKRTDF